MSSPQEIRTIAENLVNIVIKKKYEDVNYIKISLDMDYDITTYKIYVITKRYEAI
jgi:hypothetical protein